MSFFEHKKKVLGNILWFLLTIIVFFCLLKLAFWQYDRGFEKEHRMIRIEQLNQTSPLTLNEVVQLSKAKQFSGQESINDFPVSITGSFTEKVFLLDNQVENRVLGYRVLQVVETKQYAVLVNLGWVQGSIDRSILPNVSALIGDYEFKGHVRLVEKGVMLQQQNFKQVNWPFRIQQIELNEFSTLLGKQLLPFVIYVDKSESLGYKKNWQPIVMPADKHFAYAFQWAALAIAWLILMIALRIKTRKSDSAEKMETTVSQKNI